MNQDISSDMRQSSSPRFAVEVGRFGTTELEEGVVDLNIRTTAPQIMN